MIVHKFNISVDEGGGGKYKNVSVIRVMENKPKPTTNNDGMDALSMAISIVGRTCFGVASP